jgi:Glycosyl hydrolase family 12
MLLTDAIALVIHLATSGGSHPSASSSQPADPPQGGEHEQSAPSQATSAPAPITQEVSGGDPSCSDPTFISSNNRVGWPVDHYYVSNDEWNAAGYGVSQTLYACSPSDWYVVADITNAKGSHAVKTYPDSARNFGQVPLGAFHSITSTFAETSPHTGIYEDAYDIWLNGVAKPGATEIMIWNENFGQKPKGSIVAAVAFGGRAYEVWRDGNYIAFVADANFTSGSINLLQVFDWVVAQGWTSPTSVLSAVDYGVELVSTGDAPETYKFSNFSVNAS